jgi:hypothetical protein
MFHAFRALMMLGVASALFGCAPTPQRPDPEPSLRWAADPLNATSAVVEVSGLNPVPNEADSRRLLLVSTHSGAAGAELPPMLGSYKVEGGILRFRPQFPLEPGLRYRAVLRLANRAPVVSDYQAPSPRAAPATFVSRVYPGGDLVPENLLKFYVHFSAPMSRGDIYQYIRLQDSSGKVVELPFLEIGEELWNPPMTRLTLFIDPGRIKRGVKPLEDIGPALEEGKEYTLRIDRAWRDAGGSELKQDFEKRFRVGAPDRDPPDPAKWKLAAPRAGSRAPLTVSFGESMDQALAERVVAVTDEAGRALGGAAAVEDGERRWSFTPAAPWSRGRYQVVVQPTLEDLAGNNVGKPFEVELPQDGGPRKREDLSAVKLPFEVP